MSKLSIVIPFFNEQATLPAILARVLAVELNGFDREVVLVDDGSRDESGSIARDWAGRYPDVVRYVAMPRNAGKGAAVIRGLHEVSGDIVIVQDADLEYDPEDYRPILAAYADPNVSVVYGSRILGQTGTRYRRYYWGGRLVTAITNLLFGSRLTDQPTCYKSLRRAVLMGIELHSRGFEFCSELTAKLLRAGHRIVEVPIGYHPRSFVEGKKIRASDGLKAVWTMLRIRFGLDRRTNT
jgi:glycosyltransferase involved in cell wall biosynthesis